MKKIILLSLLLVCISLSCSKEDSFHERIQGKWLFQEIYINDHWQDVSSEDHYIFISENYITAPYNSKYEISENDNIIFEDGVIFNVLFLEEGAMKWSHKNGTHLKLTCN